MSPTFGERITELEEKLDYFGQILDLLLQAVGLLDENSEWIGPSGDSPPAG